MKIDVGWVTSAMGRKQTVEKRPIADSFSLLRETRMAAKRPMHSVNRSSTANAYAECMDREQIDWLNREGRRKASLTGIACREDGSRLRVVVTNLSYQGCHLFAEDPICQGETFDLTVPSMGAVKAQVRWSDGESAGVRFLVGESAAEQRRARLGF